MSDTQEAAATETVTAPDTQIANHEADDRAAMIAIADSIRGEGGEETTEETPERDASGKFLPKNGAPAKTEAAPAEDEPKSKIALAIRAREAAQQTRDAAKVEAEAFFNDTKSRAEKEAERIISEARARAEREVGEWKAKFKTTPLQAIKDQGIDTRTLVDEVQREGSPEWQAQKRIEAALEESRAELKGLKAWKEEQTKAAEENERRFAAHRRTETEAKFVGMVPDGSALRTLYDPAEILQKAHAMADQYREKTGDVASLEDLRDYLEEQAAKKLATIRAAETPGAKNGAAQKKANGPRTPSSLSASERRTSPKTYVDPNSEEGRDAMKQAAEDAMNAFAKT